MCRTALWCAFLLACSTAIGAAPEGAPDEPAAQPVACLSSGDGYLRARLDGAISAEIDWPNSGTHCDGEARLEPRGVRLSFERPGGSSPDLLFVFGIGGIREGESARSVGVNLTVILQGGSEIFGTRGESRCTIDSLSQRPLDGTQRYRVEARGFCTQPAREVRGGAALLVSRFDFAGIVSYPRDDATPAGK